MYKKSEVMNGVLKEELDRLKKLERYYCEEIENLLKGSILKRKISNNQYFYLKFRDNLGKVESKYIKASELQEVLRQLDERKRMVNLLKQIKTDIKILEKTLKKQ